MRAFLARFFKKAPPTPRLLSALLQAPPHKAESNRNCMMITNCPDQRLKKRYVVLSSFHIYPHAIAMPYSRGGRSEAQHNRRIRVRTYIYIGIISLGCLNTLYVHAGTHSQSHTQMQIHMHTCTRTCTCTHMHTMVAPCIRSSAGNTDLECNRKFPTNLLHNKVH